MNSKDLHTQLHEIIEAVEIHSSDSFTFAGVLYHPADSVWSPRPLSPDRPLVTQLQNQLYLRCYCQAFSPEQPEQPPFGELDHQFIRKLSEANSSRGRWENDWEIKRIMPSGQVLVEKHNMMRVLAPGELPGDGIHDPSEVGSKITVRLEKESYTAQPGFYIVYGETPSDAAGDTLVRFYFNHHAEGAETLVALLSRHLNRFQIPFQFKCPSCPTQYYRRDAGVLYIRKRCYRITAELMAPIYDQTRPYLDQDTPLFTKPLAAGLGLAEDPDAMMGFGMHLCRILAQGLWNAFDLGITGASHRFRVVERRFTAYGIHLDHPYLNPGSHDQYPFPIPSTSLL